jgi:solute carrier family 25 carnitine/acylcarnitine transporter 20/29
MIAGVMAGFGLWGSMFPIDTIKSKIQADSLSKPEFKGTLDCLSRSLSVEGHAGGEQAAAGLVVELRQLNCVECIV